MWAGVNGVGDGFLVFGREGGVVEWLEGWVDRFVHE